MVVKNAFECKSCERVLFDNNLIENVWVQGQMGFAVVLTVRTGQSGDIAVVNDITVTNNVLKNVVSFVNMLNKDDTCGPKDVGGLFPNCHNAGDQARWNISNNLILLWDPKTPGGNRNVALALNGSLDRINHVVGTPKDIVFQHNTTVSSPSSPCNYSIYFSKPSPEGWPPYVVSYNIWILDNVLCRAPTGQWGLQGTEGLKQYMGKPEPLDPRFSGNFIYSAPGDRGPSFPPHNSVSSKPPAFSSKFEFSNSPAAAANSTDKKPVGFSPEGVSVSLDSLSKE
jgi:hypothetical protein